jgi:hypothetical protein
MQWILILFCILATGGMVVGAIVMGRQEKESSVVAERVKKLGSVDEPQQAGRILRERSL